MSLSYLIFKQHHHHHFNANPLTGSSSTVSNADMRASQLNTLLKEAERCVTDLNTCISGGMQANGSLGAALLKVSLSSCHFHTFVCRPVSHPRRHTDRQLGSSIIHSFSYPFIHSFIVAPHPIGTSLWFHHHHHAHCSWASCLMMEPLYVSLCVCDCRHEPVKSISNSVSAWRQSLSHTQRETRRVKVESSPALGEQ